MWSRAIWSDLGPRSAAGLLGKESVDLILPDVHDMGCRSTPHSAFRSWSGVAGEEWTTHHQVLTTSAVHTLKADETCMTACRRRWVRCNDAPVREGAAIETLGLYNIDFYTNHSATSTIRFLRCFFTLLVRACLILVGDSKDACLQENCSQCGRYLAKLPLIGILT